MTRRSSDGPSRSGSSTPARTRCEARSSARDRPAAAHRARRRDRDRQDRARDPAGRGDRRDRAGRQRSSRPIRARSSGASTSGRPRRAPRTGRASRTTASTSSSPTAPFSVADFVVQAHARWPRSAPRTASPSWPAGRGCTCAPSAAASTPTPSPATGRSAPGSRRRCADPMGSSHWSNACERSRPPRPHASTPGTRAGSCAHSSVRRSSAMRHLPPCAATRARAFGWV